MSNPHHLLHTFLWSNDLDASHEFKYPTIKSSAWVHLDFDHKMVAIVWTCCRCFSIIIHNGLHKAILAEKFDADCTVGCKHIDHLIGVVGHIKIRLRDVCGFQNFYSGQTIYTEVRQSMMLMGISDQVVVIVFPFQSVGVQLIEIAIMFENSLFFLGVLIILKLDLMTLQYGILDTINDVIDLFVMWLNSARNRSQALELFGL